MRIWAGIAFLLFAAGALGCLRLAVVGRSWTVAGYAILLLLLAYGALFFLTAGV